MAVETGVTPIRWDLVGEDAITQGADWIRYIALYYLDPDDGQEKLWDTTGYTGQLTIRDSFDSPARYVATTDNGGITTGLQGPDNEYCLRISFPASATNRTNNHTLNQLQFGVWDLELANPYGFVTRVYEGRVALSREVTY